MHAGKKMAEEAAGGHSRDIDLWRTRESDRLEHDNRDNIKRRREWLTASREKER